MTWHFILALFGDVIMRMYCMIDGSWSFVEVYVCGLLNPVRALQITFPHGGNEVGQKVNLKQ